MPFAPGDHVHVASFGKGVVRERRNRGRYVVEVKGRPMVVEESQLTALRSVPAAAPATSEAGRLAERLARGSAPATLDLHGMTSGEAIAALDAFLDDAILAGHVEVRVIHGRTGGTLKRAVHGRLRTFASVRGFRLDPGNPGVTIVTL